MTPDAIARPAGAARPDPKHTSSERTDRMADALRVLLADDDTEARRTLVDLLTSFGHTVVGDVATGSAAVETARTVAPDVVLLDVHMPDGSGLEAAERILADHPATAIVLFSGDHALTFADIESTGAVMFLAKPVPPTSLDAALRLAARQARTLSEARDDATLARKQLDDRKLIERAKGILMRRTGSSEQEAYRILQRTSQDRSQSMVAIAKAVIDSEPGAR